MQGDEGAVPCSRCKAPNFLGHICADVARHLTREPVTQNKLVPVQQQYANSYELIRGNIDSAMNYGYPNGYPQAQWPLNEYWESYYRNQALIYGLYAQSAYNNINIIPPPPPPSEPVLPATHLVPPHDGSIHSIAQAVRSANAASAWWSSHSTAVVLPPPSSAASAARKPPPAVPSNQSKRKAMPTPVIKFKSPMTLVPLDVHSHSSKKAAKKPTSTSSSKKFLNKSSKSPIQAHIHSRATAPPESLYIQKYHKYILSVPPTPLSPLSPTAAARAPYLSAINHYRYSGLPSVDPRGAPAVQTRIGTDDIHRHLEAMLAAAKRSDPIYIPPFHEFRLHSLAECGYCWFLLRSLLAVKNKADRTSVQEEPLNLVIREGPRE